jgi:tetratricopeptide (TPR) repeat protein
MDPSRRTGPFGASVLWVKPVAGRALPSLDGAPLPDPRPSRQSPRPLPPNRRLIPQRRAAGAEDGDAGGGGQDGRRAARGVSSRCRAGGAPIRANDLTHRAEGPQLRCMEYDFSTLSHSDFEELTRDLIGRELAVRFEAFPEGPDDGMDGRHLSADGSIILQAKHYRRSGLSALKSKMKKERATIDALQAKRYILATSTPLTPKNKIALAEIIGPALLSPGDIFGPDDLNALLRKYPDVEISHPKLWGQSTAVLTAVVTGAVTDALPSPDPALAKAPFILPQTDNAAFTGRADELERLQDWLLGTSAATVSSIAGLSGTGGIGKSALAVHFADKYRVHFSDGIIGLRVDGKEPEELSRAFARHVGVNIDADDDRPATEIMQAVFGPRNCLLIFDNADRSNIRDLIPGGQTKVIVTTRDRALPIALDIPPAGRVDVPVLPKEDALQLLRANHGERIDRDLGQAERLIELVGGLPLALQVISAILSLEPWRPLQDLADELEAERNRLTSLAIEGIKHLDVRASFNLSLARMTDAEAEVFASASVCDPAGFSVRAAEAASGRQTEEVSRLLSRLRRFSVLNDIPGKYPPRFVFHPLMLEFAKEVASERRIDRSAAERHSRYYSGFFGTHPFTGGDNVEFVAELGEAVIAALWSAGNRVFDPRFLISLQGWLDRTARWHDAIRVLRAYDEIECDSLDEEARLNIVHQLARVLTRVGDFSEAVQLIEDRSLHGCSSSPRLEAAVLNTYGSALQRQGNFDKAIDAFRKSAAINERIDDRRGQAMVLNSLGGVLQRQGKFDEAVKAFRKSTNLLTEQGDERGQAMVKADFRRAQRSAQHRNGPQQPWRRASAAGEIRRGRRGIREIEAYSGGCQRSAHPRHGPQQPWRRAPAAGQIRRGHRGVPEIGGYRSTDRQSTRPSDGPQQPWRSAPAAGQIRRGHRGIPEIGGYRRTDRQSTRPSHGPQ